MTTLIGDCLYVSGLKAGDSFGALFGDQDKHGQMYPNAQVK